ARVHRAQGILLVEEPARPVSREGEVARRAARAHGTLVPWRPGRASATIPAMNQLMRALGLSVALAAAAGCATASVDGQSQSRPPTVEVLPNGLTLIVQEHRASDIAAVYMWVATGVRYETPETLGHAHFQEHMLFKGTDKFGPGYIDRTVEGTGG